MKRRRKKDEFRPKPIEAVTSNQARGINDLIGSLHRLIKDMGDEREVLDRMMHHLYEGISHLYG